jgi:gamma-glutamyltranspeptidase/glutathione hydrolase
MLQSQMIAKRAAVSTPHPEAALAGKQVLEKGGNAIDAVVAATITLCTVIPGSTGMGGYGGTMVAYLADKKKVVSVDFDSRAPKAFRDELYHTEDARKLGYLSITTPAVVAGLDLALRTYGTMSWSEVTQHAIKLAEEGFPLDPVLHLNVSNWVKQADPVSLHAFLPDGKVPKVGEPFIQKDFGKFLRILAERGPGALYHGEIPRMIAKQVQSHGGILAEEDFHADLAQDVAPLKITYRGCDVYTSPLPAGGISTLQILKTLERFELTGERLFNPQTMHLFAEVAKRVWDDRLTYLGDPDFSSVPVERLLSDGHADGLASDVRKGGNYRAKALPPPKEQHTANASCIDAKGNACSFTSTQGVMFGSHVVIDGIGLLLAHGMSRFNYKKDHPNYPAPGKRMMHNMVPLIVMKDGQLKSVIGHIGGPTIINVSAQLTMGVIDHNESPSYLVTGPRMHTEGGEPLEVWNMPEETTAGLQKFGHETKQVERIGGPANVLTFDSATAEIRPASSHGNECIGVLQSE